MIERLRPRRDAVYDAKRRATQPHRNWYSSKDWKRLRAERLQRATTMPHQVGLGAATLTQTIAMGDVSLLVAQLRPSKSSGFWSQRMGRI